MGNRSSVAHLYARVSSEEQLKGGGMERQTAADTTEFCKRFDFTLGKKVWADDGVSAWKGLNASPDHDLGKFLTNARKGLIPRGDCLLVENWDRLSRQDVWAAVGLVRDLREIGISVGLLDRMKLVRYDSRDFGDFIEAAVGFGRGNDESNIKSFRNKERWKVKRKAAREGRPQPPRKKDGAVNDAMTNMLPAWVEIKDGKKALLPGPVRAIRRIFALAAAGYGQVSIVKRLIAEKVPPFGGGGRWSRSYVGYLLRDRRVLGELVPFTYGEPAPGRKRGKRLQEGPAIIGYLPAAVTEEEWDAARRGCSQRRLKRGPLGRHINLFSGLLWSARDGESYICTTSFGSRQRGGKGTGQRVLKNTAAAQGRGRIYTFPLATFEAAVLSCLREIKPSEVLGDDSGGASELAVLQGEWGRVEDELAQAKSFMDKHGFSEVIGERVVKLESLKAELTGKLVEARDKAAHPLSETWGEAQTLIDVLDRAPDPEDARLRLRAALRRVVEGIWLLVIPRGNERLAAVQVRFNAAAPGGKGQREYLIWHTPHKANGSGKRSGWWRVASMRSPSWTFDPDSPFATFGLVPFDLRDPRSVERLDEELSGDVSWLEDYFQLLDSPVHPLP